MVKAIIFDMWNTLVYNKKRHPIVELQKRFHVLNIRKLDEIVATRHFASPEATAEAVLNSFGIMSKRKIWKQVLVRMWKRGLNPVVFDDVIPALTQLSKKYKLAIVSNTEYFSVERIEQLGLFEYMDELVFSCDVGLLKPDPEIFGIALKRLKVKPRDAIMVGDNYEEDILGAKKAGMDAILIKRKNGYLMRKEKQKYAKTIASLSELEAKW
ncbi:MAG: HAD family hydrolase [Candidatus Woesearchaeota archaeon]